jgi:hypothetical protein
MTPQERDLLTNLVDRLRQSPPQPRDAEAGDMIDALVREKPDTPYVLAQTVLIQDYALHQAQARIADLEQQLARGVQSQPQSGGFLDAIFGGGKPAGAPPVRAQTPAYAPQPQPQYQPAGGPWGSASTTAAPQMFAQSAQPSFLRSAATTAAGIAGGALLFQGIESLMGGHGGFGGGFGGASYGGFGGQPGITETVVNNYYGDSAPGAGNDTTQADYSGSAQDGGFTDADYDTGGDFDSGGDFSSDV